MNKTEDQKKKSEELKSKQVDQILKLLLESSKGMTAVEVGVKINIKDTRLVRELIRTAIKVAEKKKLNTSRKRMDGKATKIYNVIDMAKPIGRAHSLPQKKK